MEIIASLMTLLFFFFLHFLCVKKPTRPAFYKKISASCRQLKNASWMSMKRKLENLHIDYLKAKVWSRESNVNQDQQVVAGKSNYFAMLWF